MCKCNISLIRAWAEKCWNIYFTPSLHMIVTTNNSWSFSVTHTIIEDILNVDPCNVLLIVDEVFSLSFFLLLALSHYKLNIAYHGPFPSNFCYVTHHFSRIILLLSYSARHESDVVDRMKLIWVHSFPSRWCSWSISIMYISYSLS